MLYNKVNMNTLKFSYNGLFFYHLEHDTVIVEFNNSKIIFDPFRIKGVYKADIVFISHDHFDHFSPEDLKKVVTDKTRIVCPVSIKEKVLSETKSFLHADNFVFIEISSKIDMPLDNEKIQVLAIPAYNINKYRTPTEVFHPKQAGYVGFVVDIKGTSIYFAGDTDLIPEMHNLAQKIDVAFLPISGTYVMTLEEAITAVKVLSPKVVVPMHYGAIVGSAELGQEFKQRIENIYNNTITVYAKE